ncbi:MAG: hypothetical protein ABH846_03785 [Patescibacteria group bacterium]
MYESLNQFPLLKSTFDNEEFLGSEFPVYLLAGIGQSLWHCLQLKRLQPAEDGYPAYEVLLEQPQLVRPDWLTDSHSKYCRAAAKAICSLPVIRYVHEIIHCEDDKEIANAARLLLEARSVLARMAHLLQDDELDAELRVLDLTFSLCGRVLMARLSESEAERCTVAIRSPAFNKMSGYETLEELSNVLDPKEWWGVPRRC